MGASSLRRVVHRWLASSPRCHLVGDWCLEPNTPSSYGRGDTAMTAWVVVDETLTETLAELSRRPTREQYEILEAENEQLRRRLVDQEMGSFW